MLNSSFGQDLEILVGREQIARRIRELGRQISSDYQTSVPHLVGVLKGAWVFMADLIRALNMEVTVDFLGIASYGSGAQSSGEVRITKDLDESIEGRHVLIVEDILDTGQTFSYLRSILAQRKPATLKLVTLLDKARRRIKPVKPDYVGFEIPDVFVVGYGLDYNQKYRQLPEVCFLRRSSHELSPPPAFSR
jgi:hypoxanthine phosphoribosyltransferase